MLSPWRSAAIQLTWLARERATEEKLDEFLSSSLKKLLISLKAFALGKMDSWAPCYNTAAFQEKLVMDAHPGTLV